MAPFVDTAPRPQTSVAGCSRRESRVRSRAAPSALVVARTHLGELRPPCLHFGIRGADCLFSGNRAREPIFPVIPEPDSPTRRCATTFDGLSVTANTLGFQMGKATCAI